jgi:uncharacterized membrane protein
MAKSCTVFPMRRPGLSVSNEAMGAFIDAVYAIAVTILALEIPAELASDGDLSNLGGILVDYAISFAIIFALWLQHRRINLHIERYAPFGLWLNAGILLLVCLIPRATTFVFNYGGDVTVRQLETSLEKAEWTRAEIIDLAFVLIVLVSDLALIALLYLTPREVRQTKAADIHRSKVTISVLMVLVLAGSFLLPFQNRIFLLSLPLFLMLEHRISPLIEYVGGKKR